MVHEIQLNVYLCTGELMQHEN